MALNQLHWWSFLSFFLIINSCVALPMTLFRTLSLSSWSWHISKTTSSSFVKADIDSCNVVAFSHSFVHFITCSANITVNFETFGICICCCSMSFPHGGFYAFYASSPSSSVSLLMIMAAQDAFFLPSHFRRLHKTGCQKLQTTFPWRPKIQMYSSFFAFSYWGHWSMMTWYACC